MLNLAASCSSFSCFAVSASASARVSSFAISSSAGRTPARRTQGRDGEEVLGARSLGFSRSQQSAPPFLLERVWLGCWRDVGGPCNREWPGSPTLAIYKSSNQGCNCFTQLAFCLIILIVGMCNRVPVEVTTLPNSSESAICLFVLIGWIPFYKQ